MANPATPFTTSELNVTITLTRDCKCVLRVEDVPGAVVLIKVGNDASAENADYYLKNGEGLDIKTNQDTTVNVVAESGTPKIYWRNEPLTLEN